MYLDRFLWKSDYSSILEIIYERIKLKSGTTQKGDKFSANIHIYSFLFSPLLYIKNF